MGSMTDMDHANTCKHRDGCESWSATGYVCGDCEQYEKENRKDIRDREAKDRLTNAAPDLLAALEGLLSCFWDGRPKRNVKRDYHLMVAVEAAKKAVEKAGQ